MKKIVLILLFTISLFSSIEVLNAERIPVDSFQKGNKLFLEKKYPEAITAYESIIKLGFYSSSLYFNLGNAYYRQSDFGKAILNYEKSLKIDPYNQDASMNLKLANLKIIDKIENPELPDIIIFFKSIFYPPNSEKAAYVFTIILFLISILFCIYKYIAKEGSKKMILTSLIILGTFGLINIMIMFIGNENAKSTYGVIITGISYIKTSPADDAKDAFYLHSGAKVQIKEEMGNGWLRIKLSNDKKGFCKSEDLEKI